MSPAGSGVAHFRTHTNTPLACTLFAIVGLVACVLLVPGGSQARAHSAPVVAALPGWGEFQSDCEQQSSAASCLCWERNLTAVAILPPFAVDVLNAAMVGGGPAYMTLENIGNVAINSAAQGCGLYTQAP